MIENFFSTDFARSSKFKWDFVTRVEELTKWQHLSENFKLYLQESRDKTNLLKKIPKKIHQIWIGPKKIPKKYLDWGFSWRKNNPDWEYKLWTNKDINNMFMQKRSLYDSSDNIGFKSDIVRYEILHKYGGIYIDTDFECIGEIPDNLRDYNFVSCLGFDYAPQILNGFLMASPQSKIIKELISNLQLPKNKNDPMTIINESGPTKLTEVYFKNNNYNGSLILPSNFCYPFPSFLINSSVSKESEITSESFAIHHWEMSWMKGNLLNRIFNKIKKYLKMMNNIFSRKICK